MPFGGLAGVDDGNRRRGTASLAAGDGPLIALQMSVKRQNPEPELMLAPLPKNVIMTDNTSRIANHYVAVLVILTALGAFSLIQGAVYVVPVIVALLVGVALQDKRTIFLCRWLFGLAAVFGPMLFFNAYLLADFAKGGDWSRVLLISGAWFVVFEAICLTTFVSCGKLRANKIELWSRAGE